MGTFSLLTVLEAVSQAHAGGATAELMVQATPRRLSFSVAVTTSDPDPILSIRTGPAMRRGSDMHLTVRDQFGPESWDYTASISSPVSKYFLRLIHEGRHVDIPVLSGSTTAAFERRWDVGAPAVAVVAQSVFEMALEMLGVGDFTVAVTAGPLT